MRTATIVLGAISCVVEAGPALRQLRTVARAYTRRVRVRLASLDGSDFEAWVNAYANGLADGVSEADEGDR